LPELVGQLVHEGSRRQAAPRSFSSDERGCGISRNSDRRCLSGVGVGRSSHRQMVLPRSARPGLVHCIAAALHSKRLVPSRPGCLLCYITDRRQFPGSDTDQRQRLLDKIAEAALAGIDYIQLREKDLSGRELEALAHHAVRVLHAETQKNAGSIPGTRLLINSRTDIALATGADGVHLRTDDILPSEVHDVWTRSEPGSVRPILGVSCHSLTHVEKAEQQGADFVLFGPVFEKQGKQTTGLEVL